MFLSAVTGTASAQTFPVQANTQLIPPYSLYLSDYTALESERIVFQVYLKDISIPELQVKFKIRIEGQGILIETLPEFMPAPYFIQGGLPERITGADIPEYFNLNNLSVSGLSKDQLRKTGKLPEGIYRFSIEVYEYNRNIKISNTGSATGWLILNDPPIINLPRADEVVLAQEPQNVMFQWTPRHTASPNSAFMTEYAFKLVEIWPESRNPNDAIRTSSPIYETDLMSTSFVYGPGEPALIPGRKYAFQIQAKGMSGVSELDLFKNNGLSEVRSFTFGEKCLPPESIEVFALSSTRAKVSWEAAPLHSAFTVLYENEAGEIEEINTFLNEVTLTGLQSASTYKVTVLSECGFYNSDESQVFEVTTDAPLVEDFSCGVSVEFLAQDRSNLLQDLAVGDIVVAGDFKVEITKVKNVGGKFTGKARVNVPFLNNSGVFLSFENIEVNDNMYMVSGAMDVTGAGLDIVPEEMEAMLDELDQSLEDIDAVLEDTEQALEKINEVLEVVEQVLAEMKTYLPDDIVAEIDNAKADIVAQRDAIKAAKAAGDEDAVKVGKEKLKEAKKKLKDGIKKAADYYAKAIADLLKILKEALEELYQEYVKPKAEVESQYAKANENIKKYLGETEQEVSEGVVLLHTTTLDPIAESDLVVQNNKSLVEFANLIKSNLNLEEKLITIRILESMLEYYKDQDNLKELGNMLKIDGQNILSAIGHRLKTAENQKDIDAIKEFVKSEIVSTIKKTIKTDEE